MLYLLMVLTFSACGYVIEYQYLLIFSFFSLSSLPFFYEEHWEVPVTARVSEFKGFMKPECDLFSARGCICC